MTEIINEKNTIRGNKAAKGSEISPVEHGADEEVYEEKAKGADAVFAYANAEATPLDEATNRRLLRKIDVHVLPWLCGLYMLQYMDKGVFVTQAHSVVQS